MKFICWKLNVGFLIVFVIAAVFVWRQKFVYHGFRIFSSFWYQTLFSLQSQYNRIAYDFISGFIPQKVEDCETTSTAKDAGVLKEVIKWMGIFV